MEERQPFRRIPVEPTVNNYAAISGIALPALRTVLEELAKTYGNKAGPWLDELEARLIAEAKGTVTEGMPIEAEAASLTIGIDVLQATLDVVRHNLVSEEEE